MSDREHRRYQSWGRLWPPAEEVLSLDSEAPTVPEPKPGETVLTFGNGRSYGDCCLNGEGLLLDGRSLQRILSFDPTQGVIRCEGGALLSEVLEDVVPGGWFLPVTPGTKFITVAGAVANDVHGKNHHREGTFGRHVLRLCLLRSDGSKRVCSEDENPALFKATIGGLGLTGFILWVDFRLRRIESRLVEAEAIRFGNLRDFFDLSRESDSTHEYTVAWIDCVARGSGLGRGWFMRGNHAFEGRDTLAARGRRSLDFFIDPPIPLVNRLTLKAFNLVYYRKPTPKPGPVDFEPFFYPLDALLNWNRMYGPRGFYQFQCVVPPESGEAAMSELLRETARHGQGSFLAVLKVFGDVSSPGLLSFPRPGPTLALDIPNGGPRTMKLLKRLEAISLEAGGALYPAKDACMSPETFALSYPGWPELDALRDPVFSSSFWRRVTGSRGVGSSKSAVPNLDAPKSPFR